MSDTIAAVSTALGRSALAVVRLSGPGAVAVAARVFSGGAEPLEALPERRLRHGFAHDATGEPLDEVVVVVLRAPSSYTGEDMVELTCHGGSQSAPRLLAAILAAGARAAGPGEFTQRAFLNGRMDLARAEAVADVIHAETELAHRLAARQLEGALSRGLSAVAEPLRDLLAETEARVDFAEDVGWGLPAHVESGLAAVRRQLDSLLAGADLGRRAREGVRLALVGRPNVGKSSLFNALLGEDRAIVTATPGTTRDALRERWELSGVPVRLADTAGVRDGADAGAIEVLGIERTRAEVAGADFVLWVLDRSAPAAYEDRAVRALLVDRPHVVALNKSDLPARLETAALVDGEAVEVSAVTGLGLPELRARLADAIAGGAAEDVAHALVTNARHIDALRRARTSIERAGAAAAPDEGGAPGEIVAAEIRFALEALGEVTGEAVAPDLLDRIFARFCIGK